jgi:hypothetical protein
MQPCLDAPVYFSLDTKQLNILHHFWAQFSNRKRQRSHPGSRQKHT